MYEYFPATRLAMQLPTENPATTALLSESLDVILTLSLCDKIHNGSPKMIRGCCKELLKKAKTAPVKNFIATVAAQVYPAGHISRKFRELVQSEAKLKADLQADGLWRESCDKE